MECSATFVCFEIWKKLLCKWNARKSIEFSIEAFRFHWFLAHINIKLCISSSISFCNLGRAERDWSSIYKNFESKVKVKVMRSSSFWWIKWEWKLSARILKFVYMMHRQLATKSEMKWLQETMIDIWNQFYKSSPSFPVTIIGKFDQM